jgi:DNA-binding response OmpR family regulator
MHIAILAPTPGAAERMKTALGDAADRYTVATTWSEITSSLRSKRPDLILIDRATVTRMELATLLSLTEPRRWPPLLIVDGPGASARHSVAVTQRLIQRPPQHYQVGDLYIDTRRKQARLGERWVTLPPIQYRLLLALAERAGEVIDCQELLRLVWGYDAEETEARELVKVHIRQIRRRLGLDAEHHHYIRSVRGFGYTLIAPGED